jgi:hypothetical protein
LPAPPIAISGRRLRPLFRTAVATDAEGNIYAGYQSGFVSIYSPDGKLIREFLAAGGVIVMAVR